MSIFEAGMLLCFGAAWPANVWKSLKSRSTSGKSVVFLFVLGAGYIFGIINKLLYSRDIVLSLYIFNFLMITFDICLFYRNKHFEANAGAR